MVREGLVGRNSVVRGVPGRGGVEAALVEDRVGLVRIRRRVRVKETGYVVKTPLQGGISERRRLQEQASLAYTQRPTLKRTGRLFNFNPWRK